MAIAFNASAGTVFSNTSGSWNHTCTGSNITLFVGIRTGDLDVPTSVTYNSVPMTLIDTQLVNGGYISSWLLTNASTGTNSVVVTNAGSYDSWCCSASYTGTASTQPNVHGGFTTNNTTTYTETLVSTVDNCWHVAYFLTASNQPLSASTGTTKRQSPNTSTELMIGDSNGPVTPAGSNSMTVTCGTMANMYSVGVMIAPFIPSNIKTWNGLAIGSVKTINGLAIASVKNINGLA